MPEPTNQPDKALTIAPLSSPDEAWNFAPLTYPAYGALLLASAAGQHGVAVGAASAGEPVGLALAELRGPTAEIVSLFVASAHRRRGIGTKLLEAIEHSLHSAGCRDATLVFSSGIRSTAAAERLLATRGWVAPRPRMHLLTLGTASLAKVPESPWFRPLTLPDGADIFPWLELSDNDRDALLAKQREQPWFPEFLSPFREPDRVDGPTSIGLRREGEVVGWIVTHRLDAHTLRYTSLFVRPDVPWPRIGWQLLVEAIRRQLAGAATDERATLGIMANSRFWRVVQKRLLPHVEVESTVTTMESRKSLADQ